jgi:signal transduction histidine kinase
MAGAETAGATSAGSRRNTVSHLAVLRGSSSYHARARAFHVVLALAALALVLPSDRWLVAVPLVLVSLLGPGLNVLMARNDRDRLRELPVLRRIADSVDQKEGRHELSPPALLELAGLVTLTVTFSHLVTDLPGGLRLTGLVLAMALTVSIAHAIFTDHTWYNPAETCPPVWHEALRRVSGPATAALVALVCVPGTWTTAERAAVVVISALPLMISVRIRDLDEILAVLPGLAAHEHRLGRDLVVRETEHALAQPLAELERIATRHQQEAPGLLTLANHTRTRFRQTLASVRQPAPQPPTVDELLGPVLTLARAIGVAVRVDVAPRTWVEADLSTAGWVMRDLVGNAINADSSAVDVTVRRDGAELVVSVADDGRPMPAGVWKRPGTSSARLEQHLILLGGSLLTQQTPTGKVVTARFRPGSS